MIIESRKASKIQITLERDNKDSQIERRGRELFRI